MSTDVQSRRQRGPASENRVLQTRQLFESIQACESEAERRQVLDQVIELHLDLAYGEASRYRNRGIALDDLRQVAALALTTAAGRYDVTRGHDFVSYAWPTIRGELRRH